MNIPIQQLYGEIYDTPLQIFVCNFDREEHSRACFDETGQSEAYYWWNMRGNEIQQHWSKFGKGSYHHQDYVRFLLPPLINNLTFHCYVRLGDGAYEGFIQIVPYEFLTGGSGVQSISIGNAYNLYGNHWKVVVADKSSGGSQILGGYGSALANTEYHIAITIQENVVKFYADGTLVGEMALDMDNFRVRESRSVLSIGGYMSGYAYGHHFDAMEITREVKWTGNFTPPAAPPRFESGGARAFVPMLSSTYAESITGEKSINAMITIPLMSVSGSFDADSNVGYLDRNKLKAIVLYASSGASAEIKLPAITCLATASYDTVGFCDAEIPRIKISASGYQDYVGSADVSVPAIRISASGATQPLVSLEKEIPLIRLTASALIGEVVSLDTAIPPLRLRSTAYWMGTNSLTAEIPALRMKGHVSGEKIALSLNLKNSGLTQYDNYDFNSVCKFKDKIIGCKTEGLYVLEGNNDDGEATEWTLNLGKLDLSGGMLRYLWMTGAINNEVTLTLAETAGEKNTYEYTQEPFSDGEAEFRIKVGKNIRSKNSRFLEVEISGTGSAKVERLHVFGEAGKQR